MTGFEKLGLKKEILNALKGLNYREPLPIQEKVLPQIMAKKNILFQSETGSGKTLAFTLGFLAKINPKLGLQMVVVAPTRELALQVGREIEKLTNLLGLKVGVIFGGKNIKGDYKIYSRKNQILVVTPGRFVTHVNDKKIKLGEVKFLVFDECDQMFDEQFYEDCEYIKNRVSKNAQIVLASATVSDNVKRFLSDIDHVEILNDKIAKNITQESIKCEMDDKLKLLIKVLRKKKFKSCLIFTNTKVKLYNIVQALEKKQFRVGGISSDYEQKERMRYLKEFKEKKINILVATDVAARGLHIPAVDFVLNYDAPPKKEFYVHRIGRTGRLGKAGYALTFVCPEDIDRMKIIEFEFDLDITKIDSI